jgi:hypothetical protein
VRIPRDFAGDIEPAKARILSASVLPEALTIYRSAGCDTGPLMMGACAGGGSGAGILFSKVGICGAGAPKRMLGSRLKPPPPCAWPPPRAKLGVEPTIKVSANVLQGDVA